MRNLTQEYERPAKEFTTGICAGEAVALMVYGTGINIQGS